jgi:hypothetical protein
MESWGILKPAHNDAAGLISYELDPALQIEHPILELGLATYNALRGTRRLPTPEDVDPLRLPRKLLAYVSLLDIEYEPEMRPRWRLLGTHITEVPGRDMSGRYWDEIYDDAVANALMRGPRWTIAHQRPVRVIGTAEYAGKSFIGSECLDLPLSSTGERVDRILGITVYRS